MSFSSFGEYDDFRKKFPFAALCQPTGGVISNLSSMKPTELGGLYMNIASATLGNVHMAFPRITRVYAHSDLDESIGGAGADENLEIARVRALAEVLERYATCVLNPDEIIAATRNELGDDAIDLETLPGGSEAEYASPRSFMRPGRNDEPIRWVTGYSLTHDRDRYVPAIMTHLYGRAWESERFWFQITTGVAAHTDLKQAIVNAICEVIERDAIAMTWLCRLPLPRISFDQAIPTEFQERFRRAGQTEIEHHFFDATSDLGVPTVYLVQTVEGHPILSQFVNCATQFSAWSACAKLVRESAAGRSYLVMHHGYPDNVEDFTDLSHGASFLGEPAQRGEFDFLLNTKATTPISKMGVPGLETTEAQYDYLIERLRALDMEAVAVDLTTDELRDVGLHVVRVVIPGLVPMTPIYSARYLGHPRLYSYPPSAGYGERRPEDINPAPQPFA